MAPVLSPLHTARTNASCRAPGFTFHQRPIWGLSDLPLIESVVRNKGNTNKSKVSHWAAWTVQKDGRDEFKLIPRRRLNSPSSFSDSKTTGLSFRCTSGSIQEAISGTRQAEETKEELNEVGCRTLMIHSSCFGNSWVYRPQEVILCYSYSLAWLHLINYPASQPWQSPCP